MTTRTKPDARSARSRRGTRLFDERGFTLIELMVALAIGAIAITSVYAVGVASSHQFREQQRVSNLQSSLRIAMHRLKRDIGRIGYHATRNINQPGETCMVTQNVMPIQLNEEADIALVQTDDFSANVLHADQMTLVGNYATRSEYLIDGLDNIGASAQGAYLQTEWQAFRRDFVNPASWGQPFTMSMLSTTFQTVFKPLRWMRLQNQDGFKFFVTITGTNATQGLPRVDFTSNPTLPIGSACVGGNMRGGKAAPLSMIRYRLIDGTAAGSSPDNATLKGADIQLVREELRPDTGALLSAGDASLQNSSQSALLDYVVSFNVRAVMDASDGVANQQPCMWLYDNGNNISPSGTCSVPTSGNQFNSITNQVRSVIIDLSVRTPEPDINFPWPGGVITAPPIDRYRPQSFINNQTGAFRVRSLHAEIFVPNLAYD